MYPGQHEASRVPPFHRPSMEAFSERRVEQACVVGTMFAASGKASRSLSKKPPRSCRKKVGEHTTKQKCRQRQLRKDGRKYEERLSLDMYNGLANGILTYQ